MSLRIDQSGAAGQVRLEGDLQLANAAECREVVLTALQSCRSLTVSLPGNSELDLAALQLLLAAETEASRIGVSCEYEAETAAIVAAAMAEAGVQERGRRYVE